MSANEVLFGTSTKQRFVPPEVDERQPSGSTFSQTWALILKSYTSTTQLLCYLASGFWSSHASFGV